MNERIKKLRKTLDLTQQAFAERIGLKQNSIALIESGKRNISQQAILSICREFGASEDWIKEGRGEMFAPKASNALEALAKERGLSHGAYIAIEKFLNLKPEMQEGIIDYFLEVAAAVGDEDVPAPTKPHIDINAEVESYRQELVLEASQAGESSVFGTPGEKKA